MIMITIMIIIIMIIMQDSAIMHVELCAWIGNRSLKHTIIILTTLKWYGVERLSRHKITRLKKDI